MKCKPLPSRERLDKLLDYNPETGEFRWKVRRNQLADIGNIAGYTCPCSGYVKITIDCVVYNAHRIAYFIITGKQPLQIDHKNGIRNDNRFNNLREASHDVNLNNKTIYKNNTSGVIGVSLHKSGKWRAVIGNPKQWKSKGTLKYFETFEEAVAQRKAWEDQYGMTELKKHRRNLVQ